MDRAHKLINTYLAQADLAEDEATVAVEQFGVVPVKVAEVVLYTMSARIDRVLRLADSSVVGIDYKLSRHVPDLDTVLIALVVLKSLYPAAPRYQCWIESLTDEDVKRTVFCSSDFRGAIHLLTARVRRYLMATEYPGEPSELCEWCPIRPQCDAGMRQQATDVNELDF